MLLEFRANQLQYGPAEKPDYCGECGHEHFTVGIVCQGCESHICQCCLETRKYGKVMELLEACPVCLESRMEALAEAVDALARDNVADVVRAELVGGR